MALNVFLSQEVDARALARVIQGGRAWSSHRSVALRRVTQVVYEHPDTGVDFTIDSEAHELRGGTRDVSAFNVRLNVGRPDCYGREAVGAVQWLADTLAATLYLEEPSGELSPVDGPQLLEVWRAMNQSACQQLQGQGIQAAAIDRDVADAWWSWQWDLDRRRVEVEQHVGFVPGLFLVQRGGQGPALRAWTWTEGQAQAMPQAEAVILLPDLSGTRPILLDLRQVMSALSPLVEQHVCQDGAALPFVPAALDEQCQNIARELAGASSPLDREFTSISVHSLRDSFTSQ